MRAALLLALALGACAPAEPADCDVSAVREFRFSSAGADDAVTARAIGPSCDMTIAVIAVASAEGYPLWAWAAPLTHVFGEAYANPSREDVEALIERWSHANVATTGLAPDWPASMPYMPDDAVITLDRITYNDVRARNLPMLCHLTSPGRETCVFYEPGAAGAGVLYERDTAEAAEAEAAGAAQ